MDWATLQTAIPAAIQSAIAWPSPVSVYWEGLPQDWRELSTVALAITSFEIHGVDEDRSYYVAASDQIQERQYGSRRLTIRARCECQDQNLAGGSMALADQIRTGLRLRSVLDALSSDGIAIGAIGAAFPFDYTDTHGRKRSVCAIDLGLNLASVSDGLLHDYVVSISGTYDVDGRTGTFQAP